jgi:hypothetical protein
MSQTAVANNAKLTTQRVLNSNSFQAGN